MMLCNGGLQNVNMQEHEKAFYDLARSVRQTGDAASNKHFWIMINGCINEVSEQIADMLATESFVYSWAWPGSSMDDQEALRLLASPKTLRRRGGRVVALPYFGFSGDDIAEDARRIRRLSDKAHAIFGDCFTLARPAMVSDFARRNWQKQGGDDGSQNPPALQALENEVPGDPASAREVYRL